MTTQPPPEFEHLHAHLLIGHRPSVIYRAFWCPPDRLWMVGGEFRTPEQMAKTGWSYGSPVTETETKEKPATAGGGAG